MRGWLGDVFLALARRCMAPGLAKISAEVEAERYRHREARTAWGRHITRLEDLVRDGNSERERARRERDQAQRDLIEARRLLGKLWTRGAVERSFPKAIAPPHCRWCLQKAGDPENLQELSEVLGKEVHAEAILHDADCPFPLLNPFARFQ